MRYYRLVYPLLALVAVALMCASVLFAAFGQNAQAGLLLVASIASALVSLCYQRLSLPSAWVNPYPHIRKL